MTRINQKEYWFLKGLDDKWKWIARDRDSLLYVFNAKPNKGKICAVRSIKDGDDHDYWEIENNSLFQFVQWKDSEPYNISELVEEHEKEGEESEVKNIEWLKEEVNEIKKLISDAWGAAIIAGNPHFEIKNSSEMQIVKRISDLINQLDEPEVLSQDWIDDNTWYSRYARGPFVYVDDLQNLLVPEQELPVVPRFVADWVESRDYYNVYKVLQDLSAPGSPHASKNVRNWIFRNQENVEKFVRAWLDGYEVEEEQKYFAKIKGHENIDSDDKYWNYCIADESLEIGDNNVHADVLDEYVLNTTKDKWENLGINDDNADFVSGEEME